VLTIEPTPKLAGLAIAGDARDLAGLADALEEVLGDEAEAAAGYEMPALMILDLQDQLRRALGGLAQVEFADNGLTDAMRQHFKILAPPRNVYYRTAVFLPVLLFDVMALGDFLETASRRYKIPDLQPSIQLVRWFQAETTAALRALLDENAGRRLTALIYGTVPRYRDFYTQYVDYLTSQYLLQAPEGRRQQIVPLARHLAEPGADYRQLVNDLEATAAELHCAISDLESVQERPVLSDQDW
jgi:hypothetical protein